MPVHSVLYIMSMHNIIIVMVVTWQLNYVRARMRMRATTAHYDTRSCSQRTEGGAILLEGGGAASTSLCL